MEERTKKETRKKILTFIRHLQNFEGCLLTTSNNQHDRTKEPRNISEGNESCEYLVENFRTVLLHCVSAEERGMFLVTIFNIIIRVYVKMLDHNAAPENFQSMAHEFISSTLELFESDSLCNDENSGDMLESDSLCNDKNSGDMLESLFTNLTNDQLLNKCLNKVYGNESAAQTGKFMYELVPLQVLDLAKLRSFYCSTEL